MKNFKFYPNEKIHNLREILERNSRRYAHLPLFYQKENGKFRPRTYLEFYHDVNSLGAAFIRRGLLGKRVIVIGENSYAWCMTYMTVACGLGVIIPVDKEIPAEELYARMERSLDVMQEAIKSGLDPALRSTSGLTGGDAYKMKQAVANGTSLCGPALGGALMRALAVSELNAAISSAIQKINPTYFAVITFDRQ